MSPEFDMSNPSATLPVRSVPQEKVPLDQLSFCPNAEVHDVRPAPWYVPAVTELVVVNDLAIFSEPANEDEPVPEPM